MGKTKPKNATHHLPFIAQTRMQPMVSPAAMTPTPAATEVAIMAVEHIGRPGRCRYAGQMSDEKPQTSESDIINALWDADRKGFPRPLRQAIQAARSYGLTDEQIAGELMTTPEKVDELGRDPEPPDPG